MKKSQVIELVSIDHEFIITLALEKSARCRMIAAAVKPDGKLSFLSAIHEDTTLLQLKLTPKQPDTQCLIYCQVDDPDVEYRLNTNQTLIKPTNRTIKLSD